MRHLRLYMLLLILASCKTLKTTSESHANYQVLYKSAVAKAAYPAADAIDTNLIAIRPDNPSLIWKTIYGQNYLLVVSWKSTVSYYKNDSRSGYYNTGNYPIWVTTAPELQQRMAKLKYQDADMRLKELLGLPPTATNKYFVEFWVKAADLFRPCPDGEINDNRCALCFPPNTDSAHIQWINQNRVERYYQCKLYDEYPWTQLGYTYDWNPKNKTHIGLSEFVIKTNSDIIVDTILSTEAYLQQK